MVWGVGSGIGATITIILYFEVFRKLNKNNFHSELPQDSYSGVV